MLTVPDTGVIVILEARMGTVDVRNRNGRTILIVNNKHKILVRGNFCLPQDFNIKKVVYIAGKEKSNLNPGNVKTWNAGFLHD